MWPTPLSFPKVLFFALRYYYVLIHGVWSTICEYLNVHVHRASRTDECATVRLQMASQEGSVPKNVGLLSFG
jgi:hypothetical protein